MKMSKIIAQTEYSIHVSVLEYLRTVLHDGLVFHCPNGGARSKVEAMRFKRMGVVAGVPDLVVLTPDGHALFIEVKGPRGRLSAEQIAFRDFCIGANIPWAAVRSVDDARAFLSANNVLTREAA